MPSKQRVHEPFVFAAIVFALTAGFGYGAILLGAIAFKMPISAWWVAMVQAHGHAQLFGWAGLFIIGVGLYFIPRLRGTTLARPELAPYALACWTAGIALRALSQPLSAIDDGKAFIPRDIFFAALAGSGTIELVGAALVGVMLVTTFRRARPLGPDAPIRPVLPFLAIAAASFALATILNAVLSVTAALSDSFLFASTWDDALVHLLVMGFIVPIALAMSVRVLPLFMRLAPPPKRELLPFAMTYVTGLALSLFGVIEQQFYNYHTFGALGSILESAVILVFVWQLDVIFRRKPAWTTDRTPPPPGYVETRKPTRKNYPDYGEFGRFELLVISAFVWLAIASIVTVISGIVALANIPVPVNPDIARHALTAGFITLLIFGVGARMLPGFSGKSRVASKRLVLATFWLGNLATLCRVAPLFVPEAIGAELALGLSGAIGWTAVLCFGINLWLTFRIR